MSVDFIRKVVLFIVGTLATGIIVEIIASYICEWINSRRFFYFATSTSRIRPEQFQINPFNNFYLSRNIDNELMGLIKFSQTHRGKKSKPILVQGTLGS